MRELEELGRLLASVHDREKELSELYRHAMESMEKIMDEWIGGRIMRFNLRLKVGRCQLVIYRATLDKKTRVYMVGDEKLDKEEVDVTSPHLPEALKVIELVRNLAELEEELERAVEEVRDRDEKLARIIEEVRNLLAPLIVPTNLKG